MRLRVVSCECDEFVRRLKRSSAASGTTLKGPPPWSCAMLRVVWSVVFEGGEESEASWVASCEAASRALAPEWKSRPA